MRDIRKAPSWDEVRREYASWTYTSKYALLENRRQDEWAFKRFFEMIEAESLRRCRMTKRTANKFTCRQNAVLYSLYLELKERFEEVEE